MNLAEEVWNETALMELLGIKRTTLDDLRLERGFPVVKVGRARVYLAKDILAWLERRKEG